MNEDMRETTITPFWLAAYLLAVAVVGVAAGVLFYQHQVGGEGALARLLPMLWVGEILGYLVVLIAPGERVVPPQRALTGVAFAMVARVIMAFFTATALRLADPSAHTGALFGHVYASRWAVSLLHILLMVLYLWLIRAALETDRLKTPVEKPQPRRSQPAARVDEAETRRQRLLSALKDESETPAETPSEELTHEVEELLPPTVPVVHPTHEPSFGEVLVELARDEVMEVEREEEAAAAPEAAAPVEEAPQEETPAPEGAAPPAPETEELFTPGLPTAPAPAPADEPATSEAPVQAPPLTLPLDEPEPSGDTAAFTPTAPAEAPAPETAEQEAEVLLEEHHEPEVVHAMHEPSFGEVLVDLARDEVHAAVEQPAASAPTSLGARLQALLTPLAGDLTVTVGEAPALGLLVPAGQPAADLLEALQAGLPVVAAALETSRAGELETVLALCANGILGLTVPPSGVGEGAVLAALPRETQLGVASLQLKQLRRQLADLGTAGAAALPAELVPSAAALEDLPASAQQALATIDHAYRR